MDRQALQKLSRVDLQHKAMSLGLKANLKSDKLIEEILKVLSRPRSATPEDNSSSEDNQAPAPMSRSTVTRTRGAPNKLESASTKPKTRTYARRRAESSDEPLTVKRVGRPATGRAHSRAVSGGAVNVAGKSATQRKTSRTARPLELDGEGEGSESDDAEKEKRVSASTLPSRIPTAAGKHQAVLASKLSRKRKPTAPVVEIARDGEPDADAPSSEDRDEELVERKPRPSLGNRLSLGSQRSAPYVEIRRSSGGGDLPSSSDESPSPSMQPPPKSTPSKSLQRLEPIVSSNRTPSISISSARQALDTRTIISQVLSSEEYAALKSGLAESHVAIETLKDDLDSERTRANRLENEIEAERAAAKTRESALRSRLEALETQPPSPQVLVPESASISTELNKLAHLETEFAAFKRETNGIIESHQATVSALDQHTRTLEARLNKLELAAAPQVEKPGYEVGTPPAPRTGKRDRNGVEPEGDVESTPSTQPNPSKRPRFHEVEQTESPSIETPRQDDFGQEHDPTDPSASADAHVSTSDQPHPDAGSGGEAVDIESIFVDAGAVGPSQNASQITTINPAELTKPSPQGAGENSATSGASRPIASLRRSSGSKESTTPKMVRTSALSFGQALKGPPINPSLSSFGSPAPGPSLGFGTPLSASTPALNRDHAQALPSPEISFSVAPQFQPIGPGFKFGNTFVNPPSSLSGSTSADVKPSVDGISIPSSPAFPADTGLRTSGDYDDFGTGNAHPDSTPPPSPSKRTMYGTELTTPLRQAFGVEARSMHLAALAGAPADNPVPEGDEDMSIDESTPGAAATTELQASAEDVFSDPVLSNPDSNRYGLDNPMVWGPRRL